MRGETTDDKINLKTDAQVEYMTQQIPHQGHKQFGDSPHSLQFKQNICNQLFGKHRFNELLGNTDLT